MPTPPLSERGLSRRDFLKLSTASALLAACGGRLPPPSPTTAPAVPKKDTPQPKEDPSKKGIGFMDAVLNGYLDSVPAESRQGIADSLNGAHISAIMVTENDGVQYAPERYTAGNNVFNIISLEKKDGMISWLFYSENEAKAQLIDLIRTQEGSYVGFDRITNYPLVTLDQEFITNPDGTQTKNPTGGSLQISWNRNDKYEDIKQRIEDQNNPQYNEVTIVGKLTSSNNRFTVSPLQSETAPPTPFPQTDEARYPLMDSQTQGYYLPQLKTAALPTIVPPIPTAVPAPEGGWVVTYNDQMQTVEAYTPTDISYPFAVARNDEKTRLWNWTEIKYVLPGVPAPDAQLVKASIAPYAKATTFDATKVESEAARIQTEITYQQLEDLDGNPFCIAATKDGTPLCIALKDARSGEWLWQRCSLKLIAERLNFDIGTEVPGPWWLDNPPRGYHDTIKNEFNLGVIDIGLYWDGYEPQERKEDPDMRDYVRRQIEKLQELGIKTLRTHELLYPAYIPDWLIEKYKSGKLNADDLRTFMRRHIESVVRLVKSYSADMKREWMVVNEPYQEYLYYGNAKGQPDIFMKILGKGYIEEVFDWVEELDPDSLKIVSNAITFGSENWSIENERMTKEIGNQLALKPYNQKIRLGAEGHANGVSWRGKQKAKETLEQLTGTGIRVIINESDVDMRQISDDPTDPAKRLSTQADIFGDKLDVLLQLGGDSMNMWGFGDMYSSIEKIDKVPNADPTLFYDSLEPKMAYYRMLYVFYRHLKANNGIS